MRIESHPNSIVGEMETLQVDRKDGVVTVTMNRPERKNAASDTMWDELLDTFRDIAGNSDDRVMVLTGAGGEFCSGADLTGGGQKNQHGLARMRHIGDVCLALSKIPQPTIAKVRGVAVGAGCNMALGCDLVVAGETARFSQIFSKRGLSLDFGGSWVLPRRVGLHRAKELAFFGDILSAAEAAELGLVNRVLDDASLDSFVDDWAARLAAGPPIALAQTKQMLNNSMSVSLDQALELESAAQAINFVTSDTVEALRAFVEKREPRFTGR
jgi:2-(1,2-epoxy-1,2-dihydrophenyl)acetyl-CoA isomerase